MICLDVSLASVKTLILSKNILGKHSIRSLNKISITDDKKWYEKIKPLLKKKKTSFIIPDSKIFLQRFRTEKKLEKNQIPLFIVKNLEGLIPISLDELIYDYILLDGEIIFFGISHDTLIAYSKFYQKCDAEIALAVPESLAVFEIIKDQIGKDDVASYVDIGAKTANISFFDSFGPISSFSEPVKNDELEEELKKLVDFFEKKYKKEVSKIIFGGGGSLSIDTNSLKQKYSQEIVDANTILQNKFKSLKIKEGQEKFLVFFINILGLARLATKKTSLNLFKKEELAKIEKREEIKHLEEKAEEKTQGKAVKNIGKDQKKEEPKKSWILILLLILTILGMPVLGVYYSFLRQKPANESEKTKQKAMVAVEPTTEPTASPAVEVLKKEELKIQILNGSGIEGEAAVAAQLLRDTGYQENINTDNADSYDYQETVIKIKEEKIDYLEELKQNLESEYVVLENSERLDNDNSFDVIITIGSQKK